MKKHYNPSLFYLSLLLLICLAEFESFGQSGVGIGTTTPQAALDITSTTGGFLPPRMSLEQRSKLAPLVSGLVIYQLDNTPGLYLYNGTQWTPLAGDHLGNHNATQKLNLQNNLLVGADDATGLPGALGLRVNGSGMVGVGTKTPTRPLQIGDSRSEKSSFLKFGAGNGSTQREWELGLGVNKDNIADVSGANFDFTIRDATQNQNRLLIDYANGYVGIGTDTPTEKLEVNGNVKVTERIESNQFSYISQQTRTLTITPSAFVSCEPNAYQAVTQLGRISKNSDLRVPVGVYILGGAAGQKGYISAPVNLPNGATITSITLVGFKNTKSESYIQADLIGLGQKIISESAFNVTARLELKAKDFPKNIEVSVPVNHVVRNDQIAYQLITHMSHHSSELMLLSVRITYTVSQAD